MAELHPARPRSLAARFRDDDAALVWRLQTGDSRAFPAIFKRHHAPLLSYCRHMLGNRDEGEDALQQAFIKAHQALLGGTTPRELRPWLYAIARNCCLSAIAARRPTAPLEAHAPALAGLSDEVRQREDLRELLAGIVRLPEDQRSALLLAELDDLSHQAIAAVVGCPVSKVKALIYQARSALIADRDARETPCQDIREQLSIARGGELRRGPLRRHLNLCSGCRDFQLAVNAQRRSFASLLPVLPSAGLATAILGHGAVHAAGAASIGGAGAGVAPTGGMAGTSAGATAASATGGGGVAAATTAVGVGAGGGTSVGALVGGGLITKLAVGGAVAALAAAGTVAIHQRPAKAIPSRVAHTRLASFASHGSESGAAGTASDPYDSAASGLSADSIGATDSAGSPRQEPLTGLTSSADPKPLLMLGGTSPSSLALASIASQTAVKGGQSSGSGGSPAKARKARTKLRRAALRRRARHLRKERRHARLRKKHPHRRHPAEPKSPKRPKLPVPAPMHISHRRARPTVAPSAPAGSTTGGKSKGVKGQRHPSAARIDAGSGAAKSAEPEIATEKAGSSGTGKSGSAGSGAGAEKSRSHVDSEGNSSGASTGKTQSEVGSDSGGIGKVGAATEPSDGAPRKSESSGSGATSSGGSTSHLRRHLVEEAQVPNF